MKHPKLVLQHVQGDFRRRCDKTAPAPYLNEWKNTLPKL